MHWSLLGVLHLGQVKLFNCNQILGPGASQEMSRGAAPTAALQTESKGRDFWSWFQLF